MNHPEIFAIPVLMLLDYYLTILGARSRISSGFAERFVVPTYELNPRFQKEVDAAKWFSLRHIRGVVLVTAILVLLDVGTSGITGGLGVPWVVDFLWGFLASTFLVINGRHLMNLAIFRTLRRNPHFLVGRMEMDHVYSLRASAFQMWLVVLPLALVAVMVPSPLTLGCVLGPLRFAASSYRWEAKYRKELAKAAAAEPPPAVEK